MKYFTLTNESGQTITFILSNNSIITVDGTEEFANEYDASVALMTRSSEMVSNGWLLSVSERARIDAIIAV